MAILRRMHPGGMVQHNSNNRLGMLAVCLVCAGVILVGLSSSSSSSMLINGGGSSEGGGGGGGGDGNAIGGSLDGGGGTLLSRLGVKEGNAGTNAELPTGTLASLQARLAIVLSQENKLKQAAGDADTLDQTTLEVLLAEGKQVASTEAQAKHLAAKANRDQQQVAEDLRIAKHLLNKANLAAREAKTMEAKINSTIAQNAADEAKRTALETPISNLLSQIGANELQYSKDSMTLAETETNLSHITDPSLLPAAKAQMQVMLAQVQKESTERRGMEARVRQLEAMVASLPIKDATLLASEVDTAHKTVANLENSEAKYTAQATDEQNDADALSATIANTTADAATVQKLAANENTELTAQMAKHQAASQAHKLAQHALAVLEDKRIRLERAIALLQTPAPSPTLPGHTIPADAVDRAAGAAVPGNDGPLSDEVAAQRRRKALQKRIADAERQNAENIQGPAGLPSGFGGN